jgi:pyruvate carboxylase
MIFHSVGAGTVEFIMDATTGEYFFMEMYVTVPKFAGVYMESNTNGDRNTRLQVESVLRADFPWTRTNV